MTPAILIGAAFTLALLILAAARAQHRPRWRCDCGECFATEAELVDHQIQSAYYCSAECRGHHCTLPPCHRSEHLCGCGMEWS